MHLVRGGATGAATPLVWAHAEYIKLVRSLETGQVVDWIPEVARRYITHSPAPTDKVEFWTFSRKDDPVKVKRGQIIRIPVDRQFQFHWTNDSWQTVNELPSTPSIADHIHLLDFDTTHLTGPRIDFTFYWPTVDRWEGRNFSIGLEP
jgi:glucoamylase